MDNRFKSRIWDKRRERYLSESDCYLACSGDIILIGEDMADLEPWYIAELCTGKKAIRNKIIFEGDIITLFTRSDKYKVSYEKEKCIWILTGIHSGAVTGFYRDSPMEVVGTVHDVEYKEDGNIE